MTTLRLTVTSLASVAMVACLSGEEPEPGMDLGLSVEGATLYRGALPEEDGGPAVEAAFLTQTRFLRGIQGKSFSGVLGPGATAAAVALSGDGGYWIVVAGPPLPETPDRSSFDAPLSFSDAATAGPHTLEVAAVDGDGRFGPARRVDFTLLERPLPEGPLVISLSWDTESDLDLRVVLPDGTEVWREDMNSWKRPSGTQPEPGEEETGGRLDFDSNGDCRIDGRRNENFYFTQAPPSGTYFVRVDAFSLCGANAARWTAEAFFDGEPVARVTGMATSDDTRGAHGAGAGLTAFELRVP